MKHPSGGEEFYDPERKDNILGSKNGTGFVGRAPQRPDCGTGQSVEVRREFMLGCLSARGPVLGVVSYGLRRLPPTSVGEADLGGRLAQLGPVGTVRVRTASVEWNVPRKCGPHGELFVFLKKKEPETMLGSETFSPLFTADIRTPFFFADVLRHVVTWLGHAVP